MKRSTIAVIVAACVWGGVLLVPVAFFALNYGCDAGDDRLVASLGILDVRPASATPQEERSSSCDEDDRITTVSQTYRPSGARADVLPFYRDIALKNGWTPPPEDDGEGVHCFTKSVEGRNIELFVQFVDAAGEGYGDDYEVLVSTSAAGLSWWC
ncbi:hypothetical protein ACSDR0_36150 [Streptosporangium sp. G11]|uniref:hypothetical protein n=1 Tax=Streptosporangium sp. G11 TaxID=3436926 RepID=UPI003EBC9757